MTRRRIVLAAMVLVPAVALAAVAAALVRAPGDPSCAPIEHRIEGGGIHVLPGADVTFDLSPPTSGAHELPAPAGGVYDTPIPEARQVSLLEIGGVMLQYAPDLPPDEIAELAALSSDRVVVAPAARRLDDDAVAAFSAWGARRLCRAFDPDAAAAFATERAGLVDFGHGES